MTFVDTGAWVALFVAADGAHVAAQDWIRTNRDELVTSDYVVDEVLTLIKSRFRTETAIRAGNVLFGEDIASLIQLTDHDEGQAWRIFRSHIDKGWSFTGCASLALMRRMGIAREFAFDRHFSQMRGIRRVPSAQ